jgi:hypothetical protein
VAVGLTANRGKTFHQRASATDKAVAAIILYFFCVSSLVLYACPYKAIKDQSISLMRPAIDG